MLLLLLSLLMLVRFALLLPCYQTRTLSMVCALVVNANMFFCWSIFVFACIFLKFLHPFFAVCVSNAIGNAISQRNRSGRMGQHNYENGISSEGAVKQPNLSYRWNECGPLLNWKNDLAKDILGVNLGRVQFMTIAYVVYTRHQSLWPIRVSRAQRIHFCPAIVFGKRISDLFRIDFNATVWAAVEIDTEF